MYNSHSWKPVSAGQRSLPIIFTISEHFWPQKARVFVFSRVEKFLLKSDLFGNSDNHGVHIENHLRTVNLMLKKIFTPRIPGTTRHIFRHARVSSTYPSKMSVRKSYFRISILSVSLVALREKLKREDPNYFSILGLGKISWNWSGRGGGRGSDFFF